MHIHLPQQYYDQAARRPRDQEEEGPKPGALLCRISQNGDTGEWSGVDAEGYPLTINNGTDGGLEVRYGAGNNSDARRRRLRDQQQTVKTPVPTEEFGESPPGSEHDRKMARRARDALAEQALTGRARDEAALLWGVQERINAHYDGLRRRS